MDVRATAPIRKHPQVRITVDRRTAEVDEGLAPLIEALWRLGIDTQYSCQGCRPHPDPADDETAWAYIRFTDVEDLRRFMNLFGESELARNRFPRSKCAVPKGEDGTRRWIASVLVEPKGAFGVPDPPDLMTVDGTGDVQLRAHVRFPPNDIELMVQIATDQVQRRSRSDLDGTGRSRRAQIAPGMVAHGRDATPTADASSALLPSVLRTESV